MAIAQQAQETNRSIKKPGKNRFAHTANTKYGMGDNYGKGVRAKFGKMREGNGIYPVPLKKLKKPPKQVV